MAAATSNPSGYRGRFGDTTLTKVFVGGLAWETPTEELRRYFDQFGDILEAVIITDKATGRSKGYGFVTFREPEAARRSVTEANPVIDGRRANCNIAALGRPRPRPRPSPPRGRNPAGSIYQSPPQAVGPSYSRVPAQMPPPAPPVLYPTPYGYMTYSADYGYPQAMYNPQMTSHYYHQMYGPSSPSVGPQSYYPHMGYAMQTPRANFPSTQPAYHLPYMQYHTTQMEGMLTSSSQPYGFQLQAPPHVRQPLNMSDSQSPQQPSTAAVTTDSPND